jgi:hypothetical protein
MQTLAPRHASATLQKAVGRLYESHLPIGNHATESFDCYGRIRDCDLDSPVEAVAIGFDRRVT